MDDRTIDVCRRFVVADGAVRGEIVRLEGEWRSLLDQRTYPKALLAPLGELLAAATLLTSTLKLMREDGRLVMQIQGGRPVSLLIAECRANLSVRAMAKVDDDAAEVAGDSFTNLVRGATFAVTIEPGGDYDSYQSLVPIEEGSLAATLGAYMQRSEQIETRFVLAADARVSAGLIVQTVPLEGGRSASEDPDLWNRIDTLTASLAAEELLSLDPETVLYRLFHQETVRVFPERPVRFACRCSKQRIAGVLKMLGREEVQGLLADRRTIDIACDFCGRRFTCSPEEAWAALA